MSSNFDKEIKEIKRIREEQRTQEKDELQEKIARIILTYGFNLLKSETSIPFEADYANQILSLINAERCVWTRLGIGDYKTGCEWHLLDYTPPLNFCPCCGRQIEVKDG
jgi:hypothetical protein